MTLGTHAPRSHMQSRLMSASQATMKRNISFAIRCGYFLYVAGLMTIENPDRLNVLPTSPVVERTTKRYAL